MNQLQLSEYYQHKKKTIAMHETQINQLRQKQKEVMNSTHFSLDYKHWKVRRLDAQIFSIITEITKISESLTNNKENIKWEATSH